MFVLLAWDPEKLSVRKHHRQEPSRCGGFFFCLFWGGDGKEGEGAAGSRQRFACFCASPQLTCVLTKFIANGLFTKWSQQVDLRTRSEVSANLWRLPAAPSPSFPDFYAGRMASYYFILLGACLKIDFCKVDIPVYWNEFSNTFYKIKRFGWYLVFFCIECLVYLIRCFSY